MSAAGPAVHGFGMQVSTALAPSVSAAWLDRELYPFVPRRFASDGASLSYVDEGQGAPILFVHGTPSWSFEWRHAIAALHGTHRCIAPDHLGFGLSDKPPLAAYKPADHARRLLALVRALDLHDLTLVVHDFGGPIGLPVLLEEPERVRSLVVVNSWAWGHGGDPKVLRLSRLVSSPLGRLLYLWLNASPRWLLPASAGRRGVFTGAVHRHYLAPFSLRHERIAPWVLGCELAGSDAYYTSLETGLLRAAPIPTHIVWGERDPAFRRTQLERWRALLPHATVTRLPEVGHFPQEEDPRAILRVLQLACGLA